MTTVALVVGLIVWAPASKVQAGGVNCDGQWHNVPAVDLSKHLGDFNSLNAVAVVSTDDVWAVGQSRSFSGTDYDHPLIEHWDGSNWTALRSPHPSKPISILFGVGAYAADDVWAVGYEEDVGGSYRTLIEHWDGTAWTIAQDATYAGWLTSVTAIAPDDVWAVGSTNYIGEGLIEHWDGVTWSRIALHDAIFFRGVTAVNSQDVWAVGQLSHDTFGDYTYAAHFDGNSWSQVPTPSPLQMHPCDQNWLTAISALASNDIWAVGLTRDPDFGILDRTLTIHWDGSVWTEVPSPVLGRKVNNDFWSMVALDSNNVWAVGAIGVDPDFDPLIEQWDGTTWKQVTAAPTGGVLLGLARVSSSTELWAAGYRIKQNRYTGTLVQHLCGQ